MEVLLVSLSVARLTPTLDDACQLVMRSSWDLQQRSSQL